MSRGALIAITASLFAVGLGGWLLLDRSDEDPTAKDAPTHKRGARRPGDRPFGGDEGLEDRVADLEDEVAALQRDLKQLRMVRGSVAAQGATIDAADPSGGADEPVFEGAVRDIIETEREEARERRTDAMRERFTERHTEILDELVAVAGLGKTERESIESLWETESEQIVPLFLAAREGERPFAEVREEADKLRSATDTSVEELLTAEQFEQYKELRPGPPGRGRGDRGGRGGQDGQGGRPPGPPPG